MKKITQLAMVILLAAGSANAQLLNWASLETNQRHIATLNAGWDYSTSVGIGYGYQLKTAMPVILNTQFSLAAGNQLLDDFKVKAGGQIRGFKAGHFMGTAMLNSIYRRNENDLVRHQNFGCEITGTVGYYKSGWFAAAEFGFDKAIVTQMMPSSLLREYFPAMTEGWYIPTAGNFLLGVQGGFSLNQLDVTLKAGKVVDQYLATTATLPYYFQLGINRRF